MVAGKGHRYGLDFSGGRVRLVGRVFSKDRQSLDTMIDSFPDRFDQEIVDNDAEYYFSVGEDEAVIKTVEVPSEADLDETDQARFELACSLLDRPEQYHLRISPTGFDRRYLAVAVNRRLIDNRLDYLKAKVSKPRGFNLRSLALAKAYIAFCEHRREDPVCLIDLDLDRASYCFLQNDCPIMVGFIGNTRHGSFPDKVSSQKVAASFIMDIAAVLKFRLANLKVLFPDIDPVKIILTGYAADEFACTAIESSAGIPVALPVFRRDLFVETVPPESGRYLTPLGLTIDD